MPFLVMAEERELNCLSCRSPFKQMFVTRRRPAAVCCPFDSFWPERFGNGNDHSPPKNLALAKLSQTAVPESAGLGVMHRSSVADVTEWPIKNSNHVRIFPFYLNRFLCIGKLSSAQLFLEATCAFTTGIHSTKEKGSQEFIASRIDDHP